MLKDKRRHVLSYGGGVNSTALLFHLIENKMPLDEVIFAETGCEKPGTDKFIPKIRKFCKDRDLEFTTIKTRIAIKRDLKEKRYTSDLIEYCELQKIIPFRKFRSCTDKFKIRPIHKHLLSRAKKTVVYIGFDYGEMRRRRESTVDFINNSFPLIDAKLTREECKEIIRRNGFEVPVKSGCFICPFQKLDEWRQLRLDHPNLFKKAMLLEKNAQLRNPKALFNVISLEKLDLAEHEQQKLGNFIGEPCEHGWCMT